MASASGLCSSTARREKSPPGFWLGFVGAVLLFLYVAVRAGYQPVEVERWLQFAAVAAAAIALGLIASCMFRAPHHPREDPTHSWRWEPRLRLAAWAPGCTRW